MSNLSKKLVAGNWYWVQDMHNSARPAYWDGNVFRNHANETGSGLCWHWPSMRVLAHAAWPGDQEIKAMADRDKLNTIVEQGQVNAS